MMTRIKRRKAMSDVMGCREAQVITKNMYFFKTSSIHRIKEKRDCLKSEYGNVWKDKQHKCVLFTPFQITTTVILSSYIPFYYRHISNLSQ